MALIFGQNPLGSLCDIVDFIFFTIFSNCRFGTIFDGQLAKN